MTIPYRPHGRQVLRGSTHIALAATAVLASKIAEALNTCEHIDAPVIDKRETTPAFPHTRHATHVEADQYVCTCGSRWDRSEGADHP